jgi:hypothetical protein
MIRLLLSIIAVLFVVSCDRERAASFGKAAGSVSYEAAKVSAEYVKAAAAEAARLQDEEHRGADKGFPGHYDSRK